MFRKRSKSSLSTKGLCLILVFRVSWNFLQVEAESTILLEHLGNTGTEKNVTSLPTTEPDVEKTCECVGYYQCKSEDIVIGGVPIPKSDSLSSSNDTSGSRPTDSNPYGLGAIHIGTVPDDELECPYSQVCCKLNNTSYTNADTPQRPTINAEMLQTCGRPNPASGINKTVGGSDKKALYGELPWMAAVLRRDYIGGDVFIEALECGGSIIHPQVVLTAAHCVDKKKNLFVRAGEWDVRTEKELYPNQNVEVKQTILHEGFYAGAVLNDVALIVLESPLNITPVVQTICLPDQGESMDGRNCSVSGWGKDAFGSSSKYQLILKKVSQATVPKTECEARLRETKLGSKFVLHESFLCAGGQEGHDSCKGDGGGPLACPSKYNPKQYVQGGIVAWGIECGTKVPSVYVDVALFRTWIDNKMAALNLKTNYAAHF